MNIKNETIYVTLSGYAKEVLKDDVSDPIIFKIANQVKRKTDKMQYNKQTTSKIIKRLKEIESSLDSEATSPLILLISTLRYLIDEVKHLKARQYFLHFIHDVRSIEEKIETGKYKKEYYDHLRLLASMI